MSNIGVVHYNFPGFSFEEFLQFAAKAGCSHVELSHSDIWLENVPHPLSKADEAAQTKRTQEVRHQVESHGLRVSALSAANDFAVLEEADVNFQVARMRGIALQATQLMEKPLIRSEGGYPKDAVPPADYQRAMVGCFNACLPFLEELDVILAVDNHGLVTNDGDLLLATLREVNHPLVGSNLDTMNFRWYGNDIATCNRYYAELAPYVRHVHLKDGFDGPQNYRGAALGEGEIDLAFALASLKAAMYSGVYSAEYEGPEAADGVGYGKCIKWMKGHLPK